MASRSTLAIGLTLLATEIYPNPVAVRGLLCASLVSGLPTFRRGMMRQRFFLLWAAAGIGMLTEILFRDAPWFFIPFYFGLVCLVLVWSSCGVLFFPNLSCSESTHHCQGSPRELCRSGLHLSGCLRYYLPLDRLDCQRVFVIPIPCYGDTRLGNHPLHPTG